MDVDKAMLEQYLAGEACRNPDLLAQPKHAGVIEKRMLKRHCLVLENVEFPCEASDVVAAADRLKVFRRAKHQVNCRHFAGAVGLRQTPTAVIGRQIDAFGREPHRLQYREKFSLHETIRIMLDAELIGDLIMLL
jgi:hypothetical protein